MNLRMITFITATTQTLVENRELEKVFRAIGYLGLGSKIKQNMIGSFKEVVACSHRKLLVAMGQIPLST